MRVLPLLLLLSLASSPVSPDAAAIRAWARSNGLAVSDRGRIPEAVRAAHAAASVGLPAPD